RTRHVRSWMLARGQIGEDGFRFLEPQSTNILRTSPGSGKVNLNAACLGPAGLFDFDGDGMTDVLDGCTGSGYGQLRWYRATGESFRTRKVPGLLTGLPNAFVMDRTGDAYPEVAACGHGRIMLISSAPGDFGSGDTSTVELDLPDGITSC